MALTAPNPNTRCSESGRQVPRVIGLAAIALALLTATAPACAADTMVVVAGPLGGPKARETEHIRRAAELAIGDVTGRGGSKADPIKVALIDDGCAPETAIAAAAKIVLMRPVLVVGHPCPKAAVAAAGVYAKAGVLFIASATRQPELTSPRKGPSIFRLAGRDDRQGQSAGRHLAEAFKGRRIAVVDDRTRFAKRLTEGVLAGLGDAEPPDVVRASIIASHKDYGKLIAKLKQADPAAIYFAGYPVEAAAIVRQLRQAGVTAPFYGPDAIITPEFATTAGEAGNGVRATKLADEPRMTGEAAKALVARGLARTASALQTYAAIDIWDQARAKTASPEAGALIKVIGETSFDTALGMISFNANGDARIPSHAIYECQNGSWRPVGRLLE